MKVRFTLLAPILVALLSGCANLQGLKVAELPQPLRSADVALSPSRPPSRIMHRVMEIPDRSVFLKQTAGGSLALGLLLGPLGVMANEANIERLSKELAQNSKGSSLLQIDAIEEAAAAWGEKPAQVDPRTLQLRPYVVLYPDDGRKNVTVIAGVFVTSSYAVASDKVWNADYHYVLPTARALDVLERPMGPEQLASFRAELREGLRQIRGELLRDLSPVQPIRRVALIWAEPLRISAFASAGFAAGDVETDASGKLVIRTTTEGNEASMAAHLRDIPHHVWIFSRPAQYRFDGEPEERKSTSVSTR
jgi:hypothetical protein